MLTQELQLSRVMFESDALIVINATNNSAFGTPGILSRTSLMLKHLLFTAPLGTSIGPLTMQPTSLPNLPVEIDLSICGKGLPPLFLDPLVQADMLH